MGGREGALFKFYFLLQKLLEDITIYLSLGCSVILVKYSKTLFLSFSKDNCYEVKLLLLLRAFIMPKCLFKQFNQI